MTKKTEYHQQGQTVKGHQVNAGGDVRADHIGDKITYQGLSVAQVATLRP
ncbi:MAG: hypothetical protein GY805_07075 [Chloroflexi bacterium]|nr:hypothetical protein [Chloroflexota bacterium]